MANNTNTVMICTAALRQDTNNLFRAIPNGQGGTYDASPVNALPGTCSIRLAATLNPTEPWNTTPTHYMGVTWELPTYENLMASMKNGTIDLDAVNWADYNLTKQRAAAAARGLYTRSQTAESAGDPIVRDQNVAAALAETGLKRIPTQPMIF